MLSQLTALEDGAVWKLAVTPVMIFLELETKKVLQGMPK